MIIYSFPGNEMDEGRYFIEEKGRLSLGAKPMVGDTYWDIAKSSNFITEMYRLEEILNKAIAGRVQVRINYTEQGKPYSAAVLFSGCGYPVLDGNLAAVVPLEDMKRYEKKDPYGWMIPGGSINSLVNHLKNIASQVPGGLEDYKRQVEE